MKKFVKFFAVFLSVFLVLGCPQNPESGNSDPSKDDNKKTLTQQINLDSGDIDFENAKFSEDAEVNKAKKISNLDMGGKTLTVNVSGVTLENVKNVKIIAAKGIGEGDFTISNCKIIDLKILGGGSNSIHVKNTNIEKVTVAKENVRLHLEDATEIADVKVAVNNIKIEAEAGEKDAPKIAALTIEASEENTDTSNIWIKNAVIETVAVEKENVILSLAEDTKISALNVSADNTSIQATSEDASKAPVIENVKVDEKVGTLEIGGGKVENLEVKVDDAIGKAPKIKITAPVEIAEVKQLDKENKEVEEKEITITVPEEIVEQIKLPEEIKPVEIKVVSSEINTDGAKSSYKNGEEFSFTGIFAIYTYSDGTTSKTPLTKENATVEGFSTDTTENSCEVTIKYNDLSKTIKVRINSDVCRIDFSKDDLAYNFHKTNGSSTNYDVFFDITDKFEGALPEVGEKIQLTYKFTVNEDVEDLTAMIFADGNVETVLDSTGKKSIAESAKAFQEVSGTVSFNYDVKKAKKIGLQIFCKAKENKSLFLENGKGYPTEIADFSFGPCDEGVKIIPNINWKTVNSVTIENLSSGILLQYDYYDFMGSPKELFIIPFVEKNKPNYFRVSLNYSNDYEFVKVTPTNGIDVNEFIKPEKYYNTKYNVYYDNALDKFYGKLDTEINNIDDIFLKPEMLSRAYLYLSTCIGQETHSYFKGSSTISFIKNDEFNGLTYQDETYEDIYIPSGKINEILIPYRFINGGITDAEWEDYNQEFYTRLLLNFEMQVGNDTYLYTVIEKPYYESQKNPDVIDSTKNLDFEAELKNGIADVQEFISTEDDLIPTLMEAFATFAPLFEDDDDVYYKGDTPIYVGNVRSLSDTPAAKNAKDAKKQALKFAKTGVDIYNQIAKSIKEGKVQLTLDETINYDELTMNQWFSLFSSVYDEVMTQIYGGVDITVPKERKYHVGGRYKENKILLTDQEFFEIYPMETPKFYDNETYTERIAFHGKFYTEEEWSEYCKTPLVHSYNDELNEWVYTWKDKVFSKDNYKDMFAEIEAKYGKINDIDYNPIYGEPYVALITLVWEDAHYETETVWVWIDSAENRFKKIERENNISFFELFTLLDKYISIKDLYFNLFADVDFDFANFEDKGFDGETLAGTAGLDANLYIGIANINKLVNEIANLLIANNPNAIIRSFDPFAINTITLKLDNSTCINATYNDVNALMNEVKQENLLKGSFLKNSIEMKSAICTAEGKGGIVTINVETNADISNFVNEILGSLKNPTADGGNSSSNGSKDEDDYFIINPAILLNLVDSVSITVSDGTKDTLSVNYNKEDFLEIISAFLPEEPLPDEPAHGVPISMG